MRAPVVRQYTVFNAEQADGLPARPTPTAEPLWKVHQQAERVLADGGVPVRHVAGDRAFYNLNNDEIVLPERGQFPFANHYYQTALHELGHSTGHPERMNRATLTRGIADGFGSPAYAKEELRAEISAMMTGERVGVGHDPSRGAAYVEGWVAALEEDPREIRRAATDAQKISDFVLARSRDRQAEREPAAVALEACAAELETALRQRDDTILTLTEAAVGKAATLPLTWDAWCARARSQTPEGPAHPGSLEGTSPMRPGRWPSLVWRRSLPCARFPPGRSCSASSRRVSDDGTKRSRHSYSAGERGRNRVLVFPDPRTGLIQI